MGRKKDDDEVLNLADIRKDDRKLDVAAKGWDEDTQDPAIELLKELARDVRED